MWERGRGVDSRDNCVDGGCVCCKPLPDSWRSRAPRRPLWSTYSPPHLPINKNKTNLRWITLPTDELPCLQMKYPAYRWITLSTDEVPCLQMNYPAYRWITLPTDEVPCLQMNYPVYRTEKTVHLYITFNACVADMDVIQCIVTDL